MVDCPVAHADIAAGSLDVSGDSCGAGGLQPGAEELVLLAGREKQHHTDRLDVLRTGSVRTIGVSAFGEHLGSNRVAVEGPGNADVRREVDEGLHDLFWRHPAVQGNP